jgi:hypothetical protein
VIHVVDISCVISLSRRGFFGFNRTREHHRIYATPTQSTSTYPKWADLENSHARKVQEVYRLRFIEKALIKVIAYDQRGSVSDRRAWR